MKKLFYLFVIVYSFSLFHINVYASACDAEDMAHLKELAQRVDYTSEYIGDTEDAFSFQEYMVHFHNLGSEFYIRYQDEVYLGSNTDVRVMSGSNIFFVYSTSCEKNVRGINIDLPKFNMRSLQLECDGLEEELDICNKWYQGIVSDSEFESLIDDYYDSDVDDALLNTVVQGAFQYWYFIAGGVAIIIVLVLIIRAKRNRLD